MTFTIITLSILGLLFLFALAAIVKFRTEKVEPDYRILFNLGITFFPMGIVFLVINEDPVFFTMGLLYLILGLANRNKWKKMEPVTPEQRKTLVDFLFFGIVVFLIFLAFYFFKPLK